MFQVATVAVEKRDDSQCWMTNNQQPLVPFKTDSSKSHNLLSTVLMQKALAGSDTFAAEIRE